MGEWESENVIRCYYLVCISFYDDRERTVQTQSVKVGEDDWGRRSCNKNRNITFISLSVVYFLFILLF